MLLLASVVDPSLEKKLLASLQGDEECLFTTKTVQELLILILLEKSMYLGQAEKENQGTHTVFLQVVTQERKGILADVTVAISSCGANIKKAQVKLSPDLTGIFDFEITLNNLEQFQQSD